MQMLGAASDKVRGDVSDEPPPVNDIPNIGTEDDVPF
jgi:hypothetical protein